MGRPVSTSMILPPQTFGLEGLIQLVLECIALVCFGVAFYLPNVCPANIRPFSPRTAPLACLSFRYCTKAYPLCTEHPTTRPYFEKMDSTSLFFTTAVFRLPIKTREFKDLGSFLLVMLLVAAFRDIFSPEAGDKKDEDEKVGHLEMRK